MVTRDARLYPYHSFEGYALEGVPQEWNVVHMENDLIEVFVLPEAGGKVWGAVVKRTGHEFIYRNEVMKFRNIALRGPWTSAWASTEREAPGFHNRRGSEFCGAERSV